MKKTSVLSVLIILLFVLTACGTKSSTAATSTGTANLMTPAYELALGTLNLEGTAQAVDSKSAAQLLPLWQLLDELSANASTAPQEITAVVGSIQAAMTAEQIKAIDNMKLNELFVALAAQGSGSASATGSTSASNTTSAQASAGAVLAGAGGPPPDGGIAGGPGTGGNSQQSTSASKSLSGTGTNSLIKQVIAMLQRKIQS